MNPAEMKRKARRVLGVPDGTGIEQIRHAFWKLAKKYHPDLKGGNLSLVDNFELISEAYEILTGEKNGGRYRIGKDEVRVPDGLGIYAIFA
ncbi:MAG: J domain-containing protein [Eubacteriales bacterium]